MPAGIATLARPRNGASGAERAPDGGDRSASFRLVRRLTNDSPDPETEGPSHHETTHRPARHRPGGRSGSPAGVRRRRCLSDRDRLVPGPGRVDVDVDVDRAHHDGPDYDWSYHDWPDDDRRDVDRRDLD